MKWNGQRSDWPYFTWNARCLTMAEQHFLRKGALSAGNHLSIARTSPATAMRDLARMVALGAFVREGERRHARYHEALRPVKARV